MASVMGQPTPLVRRNASGENMPAGPVDWAGNSGETNAGFFGNNPAPPSSQSLYNPATQTYSQTPIYQQSGGGNTGGQPSSLPPSMQSLARASTAAANAGGGGGYNPQSSGSYTPTVTDPGIQQERQRQEQLDAQRTQQSQQFATQQQNAGIEASKDAVKESEAFTREQQLYGKANQDRMLALIQGYLPSTTGPQSVVSGDDASATAAQDAAFARAKDRSSQLARSSLMSLRSAAAERGVNVAGGNNPALLATEGRTLQAANQPLSDLIAQQAQDTTDRAHSVADRNYQGNVTLAGQRAQLAPSLLSLLSASTRV